MAGHAVPVTIRAETPATMLDFMLAPRAEREDDDKPDEDEGDDGDDEGKPGAAPARACHHDGTIAGDVPCIEPPITIPEE
ncbi:MAG: hypothetical protein Q6370_002190 [Candidatus Sigynarchaeota archaeon]